MIEDKKIKCLQWSGSQKCWHQGDLVDLMRHDLLRVINSDDKSDWVTVAISYDTGELTELSEKIDWQRKDYMEMKERSRHG